MGWRVAQDPGTASSRYGTEVASRKRASAWEKVKIKKKKLEFEGGDEGRGEEPHRVRRGYFNCAKSYLMLERGCNVKIFLFSHIALSPFLLTLWGNSGVGQGGRGSQ